MSARSLSDARNRKKIAQTILDSGKFKDTLSDSVKANLTNSINSQISTIQTKLGTKGLGEATIKAQQELAEKFGIVTFDTKGNISTVPLTREIDHTIDVGNGRFTSNAFIESVNTLQTKLKQTSSGGNLIDDFIVKPIRDLFDNLFGSVEFEDLDILQQTKIKTIDTELFQLRAQKENIESEILEIQKKPISGKNEILRNQFQINLKTKALNNIQNQIDILLQQRKQIFKQFAADTKVKDEIVRLTKEMKRVLEIRPLTNELKAKMSELIQEGSFLLEKMLSEGIDIQRELVSDLQTSMNALNFSIKEPIKEAAQELNLDLDFIKEGLFGVGTVMADAFERLLNPTQDDITKQLIQIGIAQIEAAKVLSSR